jgi:thioredoxin-related protein
MRSIFKASSRYYPVLFLLQLLLASVLANAQQTAIVQASEQATASLFEPMSDNTAERMEEKAEGVQWMTFEEAMKAMEEEPRKVFIDLYTDWCGWCKRMDANTFSNPVVAEYLNTEWYPVKFDAEQKEPVTYKGKEYTFVPSGRRGYNQLAAELAAGRLSYPTTIYLDESGDPIQAIPGYKDAKALDKILKFFGEDHYRNKTWVQFQENYRSPLKQ